MENRIYRVTAPQVKLRLFAIVRAGEICGYQEKPFPAHLFGRFPPGTYMMERKTLVMRLSDDEVVEIRDLLAKGDSWEAVNQLALLFAGQYKLRI